MSVRRSARGRAPIRKAKALALKSRSSGKGARTKLPGLRGLTLRGPELAMAILGKQKLIENRSWPCPPDLIGKWFALHVGSGSTPVWIRQHVEKAWRADRAPRELRGWRPGDKSSDDMLLPRCAIVGLVRIRGVHRISREEKRSNPWALGPLGWELDRVVPVEPPIRNVTGFLGLWKVQKQVGPSQMSRLNRLLRAVQSRGQ